MTYEKAIEVLKKNKPTSDPRLCGQELCLACDIAMESIEKQIPKKPKVLKVHDISEYKYGNCECGEHIMDDEKFCSNCGQAIDWSE